MTITKKHFEEIAKIINHNYDREDCSISTYLISDLAIYFTRINKRFQGSKFAEACCKKTVVEKQAQIKKA
jgi:hypothetical protein